MDMGKVTDLSYEVVPEVPVIFTVAETVVPGVQVDDADTGSVMNEYGVTAPMLKVDGFDVPMVMQLGMVVGTIFMLVSGIPKYGKI